MSTGLQRSLLIVLAAAIAAVGGDTASAQRAGVQLEETEGVGIDQKIGATVPQDAIFMTEASEMVSMGDLFGEQPVLLTLNYIDCPLLCSQQLDSLVAATAGTKLTLGEDFRIVTVSIHPGDKPEQLAAQKARYVTEYRGLLQDAGRDVDQDVAMAGWTMLRGDRANIDAVADAVGFNYKWLPETQEYSHAAPTIVCSPDGVVTQYSQGVGMGETVSRELELMLIDASDGKLGSIIDVIFLSCFKYDPDSGSYKLAFGMLRGAAALTIFAILTGIFFMRRTEVQRDAGDASAAGAREERDVS